MTEKHAPRLQQAVFELIGRANPQAVSSLHELENGVCKFWDTYTVGFAIADGETISAFGGTLEERIQARIAYVQVSLGRRLADLLTSLIMHINDIRLLDAALSTRASLELAGAIVYYERKISSLLTTGISTQEQMNQFNDLVNKATRGGRFDWFRWFQKGADLNDLIAEYASDDTKPTSPVQVKNVLDFIKALDQAVALEEQPPGVIRSMYGLLCDICHPAVGGYMLYVAIPQTSGILTFDAHPNLHVASWFLGSIVSPCGNRLMKQAMVSLNRLTHIAKTVKAIAKLKE